MEPADEDLWVVYVMKSSSTGLPVVMRNSLQTDFALETEVIQYNESVHVPDYDSSV